MEMTTTAKKDEGKKKSATPATLKLKASEASKVKGGRAMLDSEQCKETSDSGTTGCPG